VAGDCSSGECVFERISVWQTSFVRETMMTMAVSRMKTKALFSLQPCLSKCFLCKW